MDTDDRGKVRTFIAELLGEQDDHGPLADNDSLIKSARLDSLDVTKIVMFLETTFDVDFARIEFDPDRFDTIDEIVAMIEESRGLP